MGDGIPRQDGTGRDRMEDGGLDGEFVPQLDGLAVDRTPGIEGSELNRRRGI